MFLFEPTIQLLIQSTTPRQLSAIGLQNLRYIQPTVSSRFVLIIKDVSYSFYHNQSYPVCVDSYSIHGSNISDDENPGQQMSPVACDWLVKIPASE